MNEHEMKEKAPTMTFDELDEALHALEANVNGAEYRLAYWQEFYNVIKYYYDSKLEEEE